MPDKFASEADLIQLLRAELRDGRRRRWGESGKLAKRIGISEPLMSQIIRGDRGMRGANKKVLRYLGYGLMPYYKKRIGHEPSEQTQRRRLRA